MSKRCEQCSNYTLTPDKYSWFQIIFNTLWICLLTWFSFAITGALQREAYLLLALAYTVGAYACRVGIRPERFIMRNVVARFGWHFVDEDGNTHSHLDMPKEENLRVIRSKISGWWFMPFRVFDVRTKQTLKDGDPLIKYVRVRIKHFDICRDLLAWDHDKDILYKLHIYDGRDSRICLGTVRSQARKDDLSILLQAAAKLVLGGEFEFRISCDLPRAERRSEEIIAALRALRNELADRKSSSPSPYARVTTSFLDELFGHFVDRHGNSHPKPNWEAKAKELVGTHIDSRKKRTPARAA